MYNTYDYSDQMQRFVAAMGSLWACMFIFGLVIFALMIWVYWRILSKAGYNGAWALLMLVPFVGGFVGLGILLVMAFGEWPVLRGGGYAAPTTPPYQPPYQPPAPPAQTAAMPPAPPYQGYSAQPAPAPYVPPAPPVEMPAPEAPAAPAAPAPEVVAEWPVVEPPASPESPATPEPPADQG